LRVLASNAGLQTAVFGGAAGGGGVGVWGSTGDGFAVFGGVGGEQPAYLNPPCGIYGRAPTIAIIGEATNNPSAIGISGTVSAPLGFAGVFGMYSVSTGLGRGVSGSTSSSNPMSFGVYSAGNMGASGTKPFCIDHPLDPENKYLLHYSAESPEVLNLYSGTTLLDDHGEARIELPHYFSSINRDPRYLLTPVGAPMPQLHVAEEIDLTATPCQFRIAGGAPGNKVSWEVKALRDDRWVKSRGAPVEADKPDHLRGSYQHPDLYGKPPSLGADALRERQLMESSRSRHAAALRAARGD
jgi:hypothetical protein